SRMVPATASVADSCCAIDSAPVEAVQPVPESGLDGESSCSPLSATASPYQCRSLGVTHCCRKLTEQEQHLTHSSRLQYQGLLSASADARAMNFWRWRGLSVKTTS